MADQDKILLDAAYRLINTLQHGLDVGCRVFDSQGKELKTVKEIVNRLDSGEKLDVFETDEDVVAHFSKRN